MRIVGEELEHWAASRKGDDEKDLFARSAFNRYYYAAFLLTRDMLGEFKGGWRATKHASIPELLRTSVKNEVNRTLNKALKGGLISRSKSSEMRSRNMASVSELADLLEEAYQVRIIADYEPEIAIQQNRHVFSLGNHKLTSAKDWPNRASSYCKTIRKIWKELGLA